MTEFQITTPVKAKAGVIFPNLIKSEIRLSPQARLEEACGLALAINLDVVYKEIINLKEVKPSSFLGGGVIERLQPILSENEISLLIIDGSLSPIQQRNLEKRLKVKVIDRTALILEIFGERANTREGSLQVELAHLSYQRSRLVRSWTHLERQRGGAGFLGGPGETQIELDRRIIDDKITKIKKELEKVKKTRSLQRQSRQKIPYPVIAFVGYTNAGKSSLFNMLTQADVFAKDLLFATLDPTMRRVKLPSGREVILSDTVGFISDLPHELIMSFRATLEEVLAADIIVHVRDIANLDTQEQKKDVLSVLEHLGLKDIREKENYIEVLNKADLLDAETKQRIQNHLLQRKNKVLTSAVTGEGRERFLQMIDDKLSRDFIEKKITISATRGDILSWLYSNAHILEKETIDDKIKIAMQISEPKWQQLENRLK